MRRYEYIRVEMDAGDLTELNRLSADGWRAVGLFHHTAQDNMGGGDYTTYEQYYALLERELPQE